MSDYKIQSVIFEKHIWRVEDAVEWLFANGFIVKKVDLTDNFIRFRQLSPSTLKNKGYNNYHNKKIGNGIEFVIVYKTRTMSESL